MPAPWSAQAHSVSQAQPPADHGDSSEPSEPESLDLEELLTSLGFGHWHSLLSTLMARYTGWLTHYWLDDRFNLDVWPQADVIRVLVNFPKAMARDDWAFALALSQCDFLVRLARDEVSGHSWNALTQSYADFQREHRQTEPYWGLDAPWHPDDFAQWALAHLPPRH